MKKIAFAALVLVLSGCAVNKDLVPTGGSKSDGIVELSYEIGLYQRAEIDWEKADKAALKRCNAWGYKGAERFGGVQKQCNNYAQIGCNQWFVTVKYQCVD